MEDLPQDDNIFNTDIQNNNMNNINNYSMQINRPGLTFDIGSSASNLNQTLLKY